jgi:hypothetical protein
MPWFSLKNHPFARLADQLKRDKQQQEREKDLQEYWPLCLAAAQGDLEIARSAFESMAFNKPAWLALGEYTIRLHIADLTLEGYRKGSSKQG